VAVRRTEREEWPPRWRQVPLRFEPGDLVAGGGVVAQEHLCWTSADGSVQVSVGDLLLFEPRVAERAEGTVDADRPSECGDGDAAQEQAAAARQVAERPGQWDGCGVVGDPVVSAGCGDVSGQ